MSRGRFRTRTCPAALTGVPTGTGPSVASFSPRARAGGRGKCLAGTSSSKRIRRRSMGSSLLLGITVPPPVGSRGACLRAGSGNAKHVPRRQADVELPGGVFAERVQVFDAVGKQLRGPRLQWGQVLAVELEGRKRSGQVAEEVRAVQPRDGGA